MNKKKITDLISRFADRKVMVIGDIMLDRYFWGSVERISPEAPVPVVKLEKNVSIPGGAANVAANIRGLGAKPILIGAVGEDNDGKELLEILKTGNISCEGILKIKNFPTVVKTRIVAHHQHIVRIDKESNSDFGKNDQNKIWEKIKSSLKDAEIIVISDYAKGFITEKLIERLITSKECAGKLKIADPKAKKFSKYRGVDIITPNLKEGLDAFEEFRQAGQENDIETVGRTLVESLNLRSLVLTKGESGIGVFQKGHKTKNFVSSARKVFDVTGAGDTVISTLAVALAAGANLEDAVEIANIAAGIVVEEVGTTAITKEQLPEYFK